MKDNFSEFKQAGTMRPDYGGGELAKSSPEPTKKKICHEKITIDAEEFKYLQEVEVGTECELKVKVKKVGERMAEEYDQDKENKITLEIISIAEPKGKNSEYSDLIKDNEKNLKD
jgi:hypothetical protein